MAKRHPDADGVQTSTQPSTSASPPPASPRHPGRLRSDHIALGAEGERQAAAHLRRQGYRIVDSNVRAGGVEIDLIVRRGRVLAFVEVKTRRGTGLGPPELAVDARKQARLVRGAGAWLDQHPVPGRIHIRFDVIACLVRDSGLRNARWAIRHIPDAFMAGD
jgi:putative endonuclease